MKIENERWDACPPGTLERMVGDIRQSRQQPARRLATNMVAVLILASASVWLTVQVTSYVRNRNAPSDLPGMACGEVQQLLNQYGHGVLAESLEARIAAHLERCRHCRELHRQLPPAPGHKQTSQARQPLSWPARKAHAKT